jgi:hypothetical protein
LTRNRIALKEALRNFNVKYESFTLRNVIYISHFVFEATPGALASWACAPPATIVPVTQMW